jgi:hypothetical protein
MFGYGMDRAGTGQAEVAGTCECGNEPSGSIKPVSFSRRTLLHGVSLLLLLLLLLYTKEDDTESVNEINTGHPYLWCDYISCHDLAAVSTDLYQPITTSRHSMMLICTSTNHPARGSASDMRRTFTTSREERWGRHAYITAVQHKLIRLIPFETYFANK